MRNNLAVKLPTVIPDPQAKLRLVKMEAAYKNDKPKNMVRIDLYA